MFMGFFLLLLIPLFIILVIILIVYKSLKKICVYRNKKDIRAFVRLSYLIFSRILEFYLRCCFNRFMNIN